MQNYSLIYKSKIFSENAIITVIVPCYKYRQGFINTLISILNQQTNFEFTILIIENPYDEESSKSILKLIVKLNCKNLIYYRNNENIGLCANWNKGIQLAQTELLTFCHDDDIFYPEILETLINCKLKYPDCIIFPNYHASDTKGKIINMDYNFSNSLYRLNYLDFFIGNYSSGVGALLCRSELLKLGLYNNSYFPCMDYKLNIEIISYRKILYLDRPLMLINQGNNNITSQVYRDIANMNKLIANELIEKIWLPNFILRKLLTINFQKTYNYYSEFFGDNKNLNKKISFLYYIFAKYFRLRRICQKKYKFFGLYEKFELKN